MATLQELPNNLTKLINHLDLIPVLFGQINVWDLENALKHLADVFQKVKLQVHQVNIYFSASEFYLKLNLTGPDEHQLNNFYFKYIGCLISISIHLRRRFGPRFPG